jgi:hypothetical protein
MISDDFIISIKKRYKDLHPLVFQRSLEKADNEVELFEILESIPKAPFIWDDSSKSWSKIPDLFLLNKVKPILKYKEEKDSD